MFVVPSQIRVWSSRPLSDGVEELFRLRPIRQWTIASASVWLLQAGVPVLAQSASAPTVTPATTDTLQATLQKSREAFQKNDVPTALKEIEAVLPKQGENPDVLNWYGFLLVRERRYSEAIHAFEKLIERDKATFETYSNYANALLQKVDFKPEDQTKVVALFEKAAEIRPESPDVQDNLGYAYYSVGQYEKAIQAYTKATEGQADNGQYWLHLGYALQKVNRFEEAETALSKGVLLSADEAEGWASLGAVSLNRKNYEAAATALEKANQLKPDNISVLSNLGSAYFNQQQFDKAAVVYGKAADLLDSAAGEQERFMQADENPRFFQAVSLVNLGQKVEATEAYFKVLPLDPNNYTVRINLGSLLFEQDRVADSLPHFSAATGLRPESVEGWVNLATACDRLSFFKRGAEAWKAAAKLQPDNPEYPRFYSADLERARQYEALVKAGKAATEAAPNDGEMFRQLGNAYYQRAEAANKASVKQANLVQALRNLKAAVKRSPNSTTAWNDLGVVYERRGEVPQALEAYKKAVTLDPKNANALENLRRFGVVFKPAPGKVQQKSLPRSGSVVTKKKPERSRTVKANAPKKTAQTEKKSETKP